MTESRPQPARKVNGDKPLAVFLPFIFFRCHRRVNHTAWRTFTKCCVVKPDVYLEIFTIYRIGSIVLERGATFHVRRGGTTSGKGHVHLALRLSVTAERNILLQLAHLPRI